MKNYPTINTNDLLAAAEIARKAYKSTRTSSLGVLDCIHVKCDSARKELVIESTDTFKLLRIVRPIKAGFTDFDVMLDARVISSLKLKLNDALDIKLKRSGKLDIQAIHDDVIEAMLYYPRVDVGVVLIPRHCGEAEFPNVKSAIDGISNTAPDGMGAAKLNLDFVTSMCKAFKLANPKAKGARFEVRRPNDPITFEYHDQNGAVIGLVMPMIDHRQEQQRKNKPKGNSENAKLRARIAVLERKNASLHDAWEKERLELMAEREKLINELQELHNQPTTTWASVAERPSALYECTQMVPA